jgi:hypothetical protein
VAVAVAVDLMEMVPQEEAHHQRMQVVVAAPIEEQQVVF